jgi:hypothetical protein
MMCVVSIRTRHDVCGLHTDPRFRGLRSAPADHVRRKRKQERGGSASQQIVHPGPSQAEPVCGQCAGVVHIPVGYRRCLEHFAWGPIIQWLVQTLAVLKVQPAADATARLQGRRACCERPPSVTPGLQAVWGVPVF